ncbi:carboxypeptidase-like regulatory domain-containing protein [Spirosoma migulaei]
MAAIVTQSACTNSTDSAIGPDAAIPQEGIVKGRVVDNQGKPVANAEIVASSTDWYNRTSTGYTNASGNYRFQVPTGVAAGSYTVSGTITLKYQGKNFKMALYEEDTRVFSAYDGAVRNFVFRLTGKRTADDGENDMPLGATLEVHHQVNNVVWENLEITLEPVGPLVDGSTGKKIVTTMPEHSYHINDIPLGQYKITARDRVTGEKLGVTIKDSFKDYAPSVTGLFGEKDFVGDTRYELLLLVNTL